MSRSPGRGPGASSTGAHGTRSAAVFLTVVWTVVLLTVQPWAGSGDKATAADSGGALKGVVLLGCLGLLALGLTARTRLRLPPFAVVYIAYGATFVVASVALDHSLDTVLRALRVILAMMVPALAWPLLRGRPERMIHAHLAGYALLAGTVVLGALVLPDRAWHQTTGTGGDRLVGAILPMMAPRVGEVGAMVVGLTVLALVGRRLRLPLALVLVAAGLALLVLSRTRTAALALALGLVLALLVSRRSALGRRGLTALTVGAVLTLPVVPAVLGWLTRAQSVEQIASLSGRTTVWEHVATAETTTTQLLWGRGLGEKRVLLRRGEGDINLMAIDNTWVGAYWEGGLVAVAFIVLAALVVAYLAATSPTPYVRSAATFLVVFVLASTFSESGLSEVSSQTLGLLAAATAVHADRMRHADTRPRAGGAASEFSPARPIAASATGS